MSSLLLRRANRLAYPGGSPGFDPSHLAAAPAGAGQMLSVVASGGGMIEITTGKPGSVTSPAGNVMTRLGQAATFSSGTDGYSFSGKIASIPNALTFAAIFMTGAIPPPNWEGILETDGAATHNAGLLLFNGSGNPGLNFPAQGNLDSGLTLKSNSAYFVAVSCLCGTSTANFAAVDLDTGVVLTSSVANSFTPLSGGNGSFLVGNAGSTFPFLGKIAAAMYSPKVLSRAQLAQWAQDPWSFWYPQKFDLVQMLRAATAAASAAVFRKTLSFLGTRIGARQNQVS